MKHFLTLILLTFGILFALFGCGCGDMEADLVFVNDSDAVIVAVLADLAGQGPVVQNAGSSPLKRGESFGFEAGDYPVKLAVYDRTYEGWGQYQLASLTILEAPAEGERWYVTARDAGSGLTLSVSALWPEGV